MPPSGVTSCGRYPPAAPPHVAHCVRCHLDVPLPAHARQYLPRCHPRGPQPGRPVDDFDPFLPRFVSHHVASELKDLGQPKPIAGAHQRFAGRDLALFNAPMATVDRAGALWMVSHRGQRKDQCDIGVQKSTLSLTPPPLMAAASAPRSCRGMLPPGVTEGRAEARPAMPPLPAIQRCDSQTPCDTLCRVVQRCTQSHPPSVLHILHLL